MNGEREQEGLTELRVENFTSIRGSGILWLEEKAGWTGLYGVCSVAAVGFLFNT